MTLVETYQRAHIERQLRIAQAGVRQLEKTQPPAPVAVQRVAPIVKALVKKSKKPKEPKARPLEPLDYTVVEQGAPVALERVLRAVCIHFDMSAVQLLSKRRTASLIFPRHVLYYLCARLTLKSLPSIGRMLGGRDHTSVYHGMKKIEREMGADPSLRELLSKLTDIIGGTDQTQRRVARLRLTPEAVREIRASNEPSSILCKRYGVTHGAIWHVLKRNTWKHVA